MYCLYCKKDIEIKNLRLCPYCKGKLILKSPNEKTMEKIDKASKSFSRIVYLIFECVILSALFYCAVYGVIFCVNLVTREALDSPKIIPMPEYDSPYMLIGYLIISFLNIRHKKTRE